MLCGKLIAGILFYESGIMISADLCPTWMPRWAFSQRLSFTLAELSQVPPAITSIRKCLGSLGIITSGRICHQSYMIWQNDFNVRKHQNPVIKLLSLCHCCCCYPALSVKGFVALAAVDVDPWQSKQFKIEKHWIVTVFTSSLCHRAEARQTAAPALE